jgi:putative spermidine/putrescine transport system substrate-binding protein
MTSINSMQWLRASREGLAEPIDWTIFKKGTLPAEAIVANGHGVASNIQGTNLCYRRDKFPNGGPRSWADFWDVKQFPGARGLCINDSPRTLIFALLADGVPADRLYPLDIDRAFKKLDQIKPHIKVWWREGNQSQQLIRDGELDMMSIWNGRATELKEAGVPVELIWNGAVRSTSTWCVLKGAPNRKLAWEFIQFAAQPKPQAEFNRRLYYGPTNPAAFEFIPHDIAVVLPTYSENLAVSIREDDEWEADRIVALEERFTQWLAS